ncbi:hypothetical protein [Pararhodobacter sp.]|uniref:hypothetical protein n=1 Tax=Pararhodobacter sp. TaxID=2127056 RepID=UPI002AFEA926|nr:hypothetical protein [Pararhodobacter sp.]
MSSLPDDPVALATRILSSGRLRAILAEVSPEQLIATFEWVWEMHRAAMKSAAYLAAQSEDRAAFLFVSPPITAAHDALAEALIGLGYVTVKEENHVK